MTSVLCAIFFLSGAAALIFEIVWFRLAGITFGNSVWASSIVLASFMGGLAIGNGFAVYWGHRIKNALRFYAIIEIGISISGFLLVVILPQLTTLLSPLFNAASEEPVVLNGLRMFISFLLMLVPASAMGATLPVLVKALVRKNRNYGLVLGALYGWNTMGAVAGVVASEFLLIQVAGVKGTGAIAAGFNALAAILALMTARHYRSDGAEANSGVETLPASTAGWGGYPNVSLFFTSFLSGFNLLALEVIWFRFVLLFYTSTSWAFAVMLAMVLLGISAGGLLASYMFRRYSNAHKLLPYLFLANGVLISILYANFSFFLDFIDHLPTLLQIIFASAFLIFPICLSSGLTYTMIGKAIFMRLTNEIKSAGVLTLTNTLGGMIGSVAGGVILLPLFGVERSFFIMALSYGFAALLLSLALGLFNTPKGKRMQIPAMVLYAVIILFFPFGFMENQYLDQTLPKAVAKVEKRILYKEGLTETIQYMRRDILEQPHWFRLVTNSQSMSGTNLRSKRYMKFFVYLPVALNPQTKNALLICYGCGSTAKALTDTKTLEQIDFVDISKDVFNLSQLVYPQPQENPINDPRVNLHVEDGRFFLSTTDQQYDLITAEPPPLKAAGVVNLYTQEYFQLIYDRLRPGGIVTYWLPVYQIRPEETKAILKAFSNVFPNSSLWTGAELEWMMVGIKNPISGPTEEAFTSQWRDSAILSELNALGLGDPDQIGSLFIADSQGIRNWVGETLPLTDNFPYRLSPDVRRTFSLDFYHQFMDPQKCREAFIKSPSIAGTWPESHKTAALEHFQTRPTVDRLLANRMPQIQDLHQSIRNKALNPLVLWAYRSDQFAQDIIGNAISGNRNRQLVVPEGDDEVPLLRHLAAGATQSRNYQLAEKYLRRATERLHPKSNSQDYYYPFRAYLLYLSGRKKEARSVLIEYINLDSEKTERRKQNAASVWNYLKAAMPSEAPLAQP